MSIRLMSVEMSMMENGSLLAKEVNFEMMKNLGEVHFVRKSNLGIVRRRAAHISHHHRKQVDMDMILNVEH